MRLISILFFASFIIFMAGLIMAIKSRKSQLAEIRKNTLTKSLQTKKRMMILYQFYADPQLDSSTYTRYNTFWVFVLFLCFFILGAYAASIYPPQEDQYANLTKITSVLLFFAWIIFLTLTYLRTKAFSHLKLDAFKLHPERQKEILLYYPEAPHRQVKANILLAIGILGMLLSVIIISFLA